MNPRFRLLATVRRCLIAAALAATGVWASLDDGAAQPLAPVSFDTLMHSGLRLRDEIRATRCYERDRWWLLHDRFREWRHQFWDADLRGPREDEWRWLSGRIDVALRELEGKRCPLVHDLWHPDFRLPH